MNSSIFPWKTVALASTGLVMLFVGGFLISGNQPVQSQQPAKSAYKVTAATPQADPVLATPADKKLTAENDSPVTVAKQKQHLQYTNKKHPKVAVVAKPADTVAVVKEPLSLSDMVVLDKQEGATPLSEMVVMGVSGQSDEANGDLAHPKIGWNSFQQYLKEKTVSPDGKAGIVKLTFTVNPDGTCADFKIKNGLSEAANQKAIDLIKNGPRWKCSADGLASEASVSVNFH